MIVLKRFVGVVDGKEQAFEVGRELTDDEIDELQLGEKPDLIGEPNEAPEA